MSEEEVQIHKRLTLNWLIHGASQHAGLTLHHLIRDQLNALDSKLVQKYDEFALIMLLQYWRPLSMLVMGRPQRFWHRALSDSSHPFFGHPLLGTYGGMLAEASRQKAVKRCREKGYAISQLSAFFKVRMMVRRIRDREMRVRPELVWLAKQAAAAVWGISSDRFDAELSKELLIPVEDLNAENFQAGHLSSCIVGYSRVVREEGQFIVSAKGITWQLLAIELVKGTAELICLHGMSQLQDSTYHQVIKATDRIELEPWMLQSGGELWRRLLAAVPDDCSIARVLMHLALLPGNALHSIMAEIIEESASAPDQLRNLLRCNGC